MAGVWCVPYFCQKHLSAWPRTFVPRSLPSPWGLELPARRPLLRYDSCARFKEKKRRIRDSGIAWGTKFMQKSLPSSPF